MAEWIAEGEPSLDLWEMDIRRFGAQYRSPSYTHARIKETYETYYDIRYPNHERSAGRPLRVSPATPWHREREAAFGEKSGWERVNWYVSNARGETSRCAREAGPASTGPRQSASSTRPRGRAWRSSTRPRSRRWRSRDPGLRSSSSACATTGWPASRRNHLHPDAQPTRRHRMRLHRRAPGRGSLLDRHRHGFGNHDREWIRRHLPMDGSVQVRRHDLAVGVLRDLGAAGARHAAAADPGGPRQRGVPVHVLRETTVGHVPVGACASPTSASWLELYCPTEYGLALWRAIWRRVSRTGSSRAATGRSSRCASRRAMGLGRRHHPRRDARTRAGWLLRQARQGGQVHRPGEARGGEDAALALGSASCALRIRARSRSATSRC